MTEYDLYHDESKVDGFWHGILLVPRGTRDELLSLLSLARELTEYGHPLTLKGLSERDRGNRRFECTRVWTELGVFALMQRLGGKSPSPICYKKKGYCSAGKRAAMDYTPLPLKDPLKARFMLYKKGDGLSDMGPYYPDHGSKFETTFRMGLKGGLHYLFNETSPAKICSIHFHGYEHYGRDPSRERLIGRLLEDLRPYVAMPPDVHIDARTGDHRRTDDCQDVDDCQLLQLADLMVSGSRLNLQSGGDKKKAQREATAKLGELIDKYREHPARVRNSRWNGGFWMSAAHLRPEGWEYTKFERSPKKNTQSLLFRQKHPCS